MAQFSVHQNTNPQTKAYAPFLLNIQHPVLSQLNARITVPLVDASRKDAARIQKLTPSCEIAGVTYLIIVPLLAAIPNAQLGAQVADLSGRREEIVAAINLFISGV